MTTYILVTELDIRSNDGQRSNLYSQIANFMVDFNKDIGDYMYNL